MNIIGNLNMLFCLSLKQLVLLELFGAQSCRTLAIYLIVLAMTYGVFACLHPFIWPLLYLDSCSTVGGLFHVTSHLLVFIFYLFI